MKKAITLFLLFAPWLTQAVESSNEKNNQPKKYSIAINSFKSNNCPESYALAVEEFLSGKIYESGVFTLFERSQMEILLKKANFNQEKSVDILYATDMGKILSVDKIIVGSVSKLDTYSIKVSVINVRDAKVEFTAMENADDVAQFRDKVSVIAEKIFNYYKGKREITTNSTFSIGYSVLSAKNYSNDFDYGYGTDLRWSSLLYKNNLPLTLYVSLYKLNPVEKSVNSLYILPIKINIGYVLFDINNVSLSCSAGPGYQFSQLMYDKIKNRPGGYIYTTEYLYNPVFSINSDISYRLFNHISISVNLSSMAVFEYNDISFIHGLTFYGNFHY